MFYFSFHVYLNMFCCINKITDFYLYAHNLKKWVNASEVFENAYFDIAKPSI